MSDENVVQFPTPEPDPDISGVRWRSVEERDEFIAEHDRRTAAGESLKGLPIPIVFTEDEPQ